jgi:hypothetical protein
MGKENLDKIKKYLMLFIGVAFALLYMKECRHSKTLEENKKVDISNVRVYEDLKGDIVEYNDVMQTKFKDLEIYNAELKQEVKDMKIKSPDIILRGTTEIRIDTVYVAFHDTLPCEDFTKDIVIDSSWYNIDMKLTKEDITINEINIPNEQTVVVGEKKNGIFKRNEYVVAVKNSNPHIKTDTLETYTFKKDLNFFQRPEISISAGLIAGFLLTKLLGK